MDNVFVYEIVTKEGVLFTTDNDEAEHAWRLGATLYCRRDVPNVSDTF